MQLIQIGEIKQKTIMDLIQEMAANQLSDRTTEGGCALQGEKQTDSSHRPALRLFRAPAVMAHRALARCSFAPILV